MPDPKGLRPQMTPELILSDQRAVASGGQREVFVHPNDPARLIKVLKRASDVDRSTFNGLAERWLPNTRMRQIRREYSEYLRVMLAHADEQIDLPIAHMFGFVPTDQGLGCLTERVTGEGGGLGETLAVKLRQQTFTDADLALLNDTIARIYRYGIRASDMNAKNFVFGTRNGGARECVLVDGFGDIHAVPLRSMGGWTNRMGLDDSCRRLARKKGLQLDASKRQFVRG